MNDGKCHFCKDADAVYDLDSYGACMDCFANHFDMDREKLEEKEDDRIN